MRSTVYVVVVLLIAVVGFWGCGSEMTSPADQQTDIDALRALELDKAAAEKADSKSISAVAGGDPVLGSGGPDTYGYTWIDSDDPSGPTYDWTDISGTGTPVPFAAYEDDGTVGPISIGFDFPFYGNTFSQLYVCSNGWMSFTNNTLETYTNQPLPNNGSTVPENLLAFWWDDMVYDESDGNNAFYYNDGSRFIIQIYIRRIAAFTPPFYLFQVILYPNGDIVYQYHTLGTTVYSSTIGIQNATKDDGLMVVFNDGTYPHEDLAILFDAPNLGMTIDIKPDSYANPINLRSNGVIPVAIFTTDDFDALQIDPSTIAFGPNGAGIAHKSPHVEDIDGDGDMDLIVHFRTQETGISSMDTEACLTAELFDGTPVGSCDDITIVVQDAPTPELAVE